MGVRLTVGLMSAAFTLGMALLLVIAGATLREWSSIDRRLYWVDHTLDVIRTIDGVERGLRDAGTAGRDYLSAPSDEVLLRFENGLEYYRAQMQQLERLTRDNRGQNLQVQESARVIERKIARWYLLLDQRTGLPQEDRWLAQAMKTMTISDLLGSIMSMRATESTLLAQRLQASSESIQTGRSFVVTGFVVCMVLLLFSMFMVVMQMRRRNQAENELRLINNTLESRIEERTRDLAHSNEELRLEVTAHTQAREEIRALNTGLEQRVRERTQQLEQANKDLEGFSYSVSHDLRTPLRAIVGFSRMLTDRMGERLQTEDKRLLGVIVDNAARMSTLIDDLLNFSRTGRAPLSLRQVDMQSVVQEALHQLQAGAEGEADVALQLDIGTLPPCWGDRALLLQVWSNLLSNAIKFSAHAASPRVQVSGQEENGHCHYQVSDNGVGFDMRFYDKLFGVFQRLHGSDEFPGTGVGLAIVARIVHRQGGRVWAESQPGQGATFHFELAAVQTEDEQA